MGGTTSQSRKGDDEDQEWDDMRQAYFSTKPNPLFVIRSKEEPADGDLPMKKEDDENSTLKPEDAKKGEDKPNLSMTS